MKKKHIEIISVEYFFMSKSTHIEFILFDVITCSTDVYKKINGLKEAEDEILKLFNEKL